jgi:hypothetical protein
MSYIFSNDDDAIFGGVAYEIHIDKLIAEGFLVRPVSYAGRVEANTDNIEHSSTGEFKEESATKEFASITTEAVSDMVSRLRERRSILVFACSLDHAAMICDALRASGETSVDMVTGETPKAERDDLVDRVRSGALRWTVNVGVFTKGFDAKNIDAIVLMRATESPALYVQMCLDYSTEILTQAGWMSAGNVKENDAVAAMDLASGVVSFCRVLSVVDRELSEHENMWGIANPVLDVRVTNAHTMVYKTRRDNAFKKTTADTMPQEFKLPCAGSSALPDYDLSDDDIRFIGWFLTDGSLNKITNGITIYQSDHQPWIPEIESCLRGCGFKYSKSVHVKKSSYNTTHRMIRFTVSKGKPREAETHLTGWGRLEQYIDKDFSEDLFKLSDRQFAILLHTIHLGDGAKQVKTNGWTRRNYHISSGRKVFVDRVQAACVMHGFACNISLMHYNKNPLYILNIKPSSLRTILTRSSDRRAVWNELPKNNGERVWCVETELGTIITRRNGKVAVMGNCGRGLRIHPSKSDCLCLDYGQNIVRHGPINCVTIKKKGKAGEKRVLAKHCPSCDALIALAATLCPHCGAALPSAISTPNHDLRPSDAPILADGQDRIEWRDVVDMRITRHVKPGSLNSMRVSYKLNEALWCDEWVCPDHSGHALVKARKWMNDRGYQPMPLENALTVKWPQPQRIKIKWGGKWPEILDYYFGSNFLAG